MFALTQDKLMLAIDESTLGLIVSIINMKMNTFGETQTTAEDGDENDDAHLFKKIFARCKQLCEKFVSQTNSKESSGDIFLPADKYQKISTHLNFKNNNASCDVTINEFLDNLQLRNSEESFCDEGFGVENFFFNFNAQLLAMECLLNLNLKNQNQGQFEVYKRELRELGVLDKIINILSLILKLVKHLSAIDADKELYLFFVNKYLRYLNFIECLSQSEKVEKSRKAGETKLRAIKASSSSNSNLNKNYLIFFKNNLFPDLIKE